MAALTLFAFWPVLDNGFINFDDGAYLLENPRVLGGLSWDGLRWAATTKHAANYHPLTWLSHMLDVQLFGLDARGHHGVSLLLHLADSLLLFLVFHGLTAARGPSFLLAALFAVHPLHVESVAWVSERKDVLSTFFWLLTMLAYLRYVRRPAARRYLLVVLAFCAGLLSKPMLVTLPFVLLLLDYWPLGRLRGPGPSAAAPGSGFSPAAVARRLLEKTPLLALAAASSIVTYVAQREGGAVQLLEKHPLGQRLAEAALAAVSYLGKAFLPRNLSAIYLSAGIAWPDWRVIGSAALLLGLSLAALRYSRRRPQFFVGWFWYLGTLVPVIGIVRVGAQALADRYTYVPLIGLFVGGAWRAFGPNRDRRLPAALRGAAAALILVALALLSRVQTGYWKDSATLFGHTLAISPENWAARHLYALALSRQGRYSEAVGHAVAALRRHFDERQLDGLGAFLEMRGRTGEASALYSQALALYPEAVNVRYRLANALSRERKFSAAVAHYERVLQANPGHGHAQNNLGFALFSSGKTAAAIDHYREALRIDPRNAEAQNNLGFALQGLGAAGEAMEHYRAALRLKPDFLPALNNLSGALQEAGRFEESASWRRRALQVERRSERAGAAGHPPLP